MNRTFILLFICLTLALGGSLTAGAEGILPGWTSTGPDQATPGGFSFRNGIRWGMSVQEVQSAETASMIERSQDVWSVLYTQSKVQVSRYQADLVFIFLQNRLQMITYDFGTDAEAGNYSYLTGALCTVYGESRTPQPDEVVQLMDRIYPGHYTADRLKDLQSWTAADGTLIYLFYYAYNAYAILYASPEMSTQRIGNYVTDGL